MRPVGRPPKEDSKRNQYRIRLSDHEAGMLEHLSDDTGECKAEVLRKALKMYYNLKTFKR